jgi:hypothetical protein
MENEIRLPLDLLLCHDVESLEEALVSKYAIEFECEIFFCKNKSDLKSMLEEYGENARWYQIDEIENDRIRAVIDLLNLSEENSLLSHILDRIVR